MWVVVVGALDLNPTLVAVAFVPIFLGAQRDHVAHDTWHLALMEGRGSMIE
jgi:hypothetical protein